MATATSAITATVAAAKTMAHSQPVSAATQPSKGDPPHKQGAEIGESKGIASPSIVMDGAADGPVTDLQKKVRRAERFGMPVMLSEKEKRNSRAERFGTGASLHGTTAGNLEEEQKRKARAERFGLSAPSLTDEDAKKKVRLERFAQNAKPDASEEEKRKARVARFSQTSASSSTNGKSSSELKSGVGKINGGS